VFRGPAANLLPDDDQAVKRGGFCPISENCDPRRPVVTLGRTLRRPVRPQTAAQIAKSDGLIVIPRRFDPNQGTVMLRPSDRARQGLLSLDEASRDRSACTPQGPSDARPTITAPKRRSKAGM
jgi:hypothetical protein